MEKATIRHDDWSNIEDTIIRWLNIYTLFSLEAPLNCIVYIKV